MSGPPDNWNELYLGWLKDMSASCPPNSNQYMSRAYDKAHQSLTSCPKLFSHPSELSELKFFGPSICSHLEKRLEKYCSAQGIPVPEKTREKTTVRQVVGNPNPANSNKPSDSISSQSTSRKQTSGSSHSIFADLFSDSDEQDIFDNLPVPSTRTTSDTTHLRSMRPKRGPTTTIEIDSESDITNNPYVINAHTTPNFAPKSVSTSSISNNIYVINSRSTPNFAPKDSSNTRTAYRRATTLSSSTEPNTLTFQDSSDTSAPKRRKLTKSTKSKTKTPRVYVPQYRSGGYAILLTLYHYDQNGNGDGGMKKASITQVAAHLSDTSFVNDAHLGNFYSAWNNVNTLIKNGLVYASGARNPTYYITEEGKDIAKGLLKAEGLLSGSSTLQTSNTKDNQTKDSINNTDTISVLSDDDDDIIVVGENDVADKVGRNTTFSSGSSDTKTSTRPGSSTSNQKDFSSLPSLNGLGTELSPNSIVQSELLHIGKTHFISSPLLPTPGSANGSSQDRQSGTVETSPLMSRTRSVLTPNDKNKTKTATDGKYHRSIWPAGSFEIILIVDNREKRAASDPDFFVNKLKEHGISASVDALAVGDLVWAARNKNSKQVAVLDYIMERKRLDDLVSSIKDGRFQEQKGRLKRTGLTKVSYLIEESVHLERTSSFSQQIMTAMSQTIILNDFFLKRTSNATDTVNFLVQLTRAIEKWYLELDLYVVSPHLTTSRSYELAIKTCRKKLESRNNNGWDSVVDEKAVSRNKKELAIDYDSFQTALSKSGMATVKDVYIRMLMTIKGVTFEKASLVQKHYPTPRALIDAYAREHNMDSKKLMLNKEFGTRIIKLRFNPALSEKVYELWGQLY